VDVRVGVGGCACAWGCNAWKRKDAEGGRLDGAVGYGRGWDVEWWSGRAASVSGEQPTGALGRNGARPSADGIVYVTYYYYIHGCYCIGYY
jgi:hypothetical protein